MMMTTATRMTLVDFVGIPYVPLGRTRDGADCWGVCLLAARELFGIELMEYFYSEDHILEHACEHIRRETNGLPRWQSIEAPYPPAAVHIFRIRGFETHAGLALGGGDDFLHSLPGRNSCVESLRDVNWQQRRIGTFRWTP